MLAAWWYGECAAHMFVCICHRQLASYTHMNGFIIENWSLKVTRCEKKKWVLVHCLGYAYWQYRNAYWRTGTFRSHKSIGCSNIGTFVFDSYFRRTQLLENLPYFRFKIGFFGGHWCMLLNVCYIYGTMESSNYSSGRWSIHVYIHFTYKVQ